MDEVFAQEQRHLTEIYATLQTMRDELTEELEVHQKAAAQDLMNMSEEIRPDFVGADETLETLAAIEMLNAVIDAYNQSHDFTLDKFRRVLLLLAQPYFAKVRLRMRPGKPAQDIYIGACGITDKRHNPLVVDWRSPVAETYYNQENGPTSYMVAKKRREVDLELRRQFDIVRDELLSYFDTTVAIQDSLLLQVLKKQRSEHLKAITATIQLEQNEIIRHEDVSALLVDGIAGSGKTSVMLQRIAYLFYYQRETLSPTDIHLFTPSSQFRSYISTVLPSLGEANPSIQTWKDFMGERGLADRRSGTNTSARDLITIEQALPNLTLGKDDFRSITQDGTTLITTAQILASFNKFARLNVGPRRAALVREDLHDKLDRKLARMSHDPDIQDEMLALDLDDQVRIFGGPVVPDSDDEAIQLARTYLDYRFGSAHTLIDEDRWLRIDRIGQAILGVNNLDATQWLYTRLSIAGNADRHARYVMVDEVQDYSLAQLMLLAAYFPNAHFLLLGDKNQAIYEDRASFDEIRHLFRRTHGSCETCFLRTSYRSSPEITEVFLSLVGDIDDAKSTSVRTSGTPVEQVVCAHEKDYLDYLGECIARLDDTDTLTAFIVESRERARWLGRKLGKAPVLSSDESELPSRGVAIMDIRLAKGLEFDHVVIADAQADVYPDTPLARRRLYTAVSRAMHRVTLVSEGEMTPLVRRPAP